MPATIEAEPVTTELADLRDVPLCDVPALGAGALDDLLRRAMPDLPVQVPVAAFNSSI